MERDKALYLINQVFNTLKEEFPQLQKHNERNAVTFNHPSKNGDEIVMIAPIVREDYKGHGMYHIYVVSIMEAGCTKFEDYYKKENISETLHLPSSDIFRYRPDYKPHSLMYSLRERLKQ